VNTLALLLSMLPGAENLARQVAALPQRDADLLTQLVRGMTGAALIAAVARFLGARGILVAGAGLAGGAAAAMLPTSPARSAGSRDFFGVAFR